MTRLILHIGTEKTGTTTIQQFLASNRTMLEQQRIRLLTTTGSEFHRWIPFLAYKPGREDDFTRRQQLTADSELREAKKKEIVSQIATAIKQGADYTWLLSAEHLQSRLTTQNEVQAIKEILSSLFSSFQVILYIRRPIDAAISLWSSAVRNGRSMLTLPIGNAYWHNICSHHETIRRWSTIFGEENLSIRLFERDFFINGDLIDDFCSIANIKIDEDAARPKHANPALSYRAIKLLSHINPALKQEPTQQRAAKHGSLSTYCQVHLRHFPPYCPTQEEVESYERLYHASDEWVRNKFFPNRQRLWTRPIKVRDPADPRFSQQLTPYEKSIAALIQAIWLDKSQEIAELSQVLAQHDVT